MNVDAIFLKAVELGASDIHIAVHYPAVFRVKGEMYIPYENEILGHQAVDEIIKHILAHRYERFYNEKEIDTAYQIDEKTRFRINCLYERGQPSLVARLIENEIPSLEKTRVKRNLRSFNDNTRRTSVSYWSYRCW